MPEAEASSASGTPLLAVDGLTVRFGGITALHDASFGVAEGRITGLIGPNGAGKTTCFNCISRLYEPVAGEIRFRGENLLRIAPHRIAHRRIARTFQNVALFDRLTVRENVLVGADSRNLPGSERDAEAVIDYLGLGPCADQSVYGLPFGTRKTIELARALAAKPELLLLDEPAAGLGAAEAAAVGSLIARVAADFRTTVLMVEHNMGLVMRICDHVVVLASGRTLASGTPDAVRGNPLVVEAYLGAA